MSVNYDIQADAVGLDERPRLDSILTVKFGEPAQLYKMTRGGTHHKQPHTLNTMARLELTCSSNQS